MHRTHTWQVPTHQWWGVMVGGQTWERGPWSQCTHPEAHSAVGSLVQVSISSWQAGASPENKCTHLPRRQSQCGSFQKL